MIGSCDNNQNFISFLMSNTFPKKKLLEEKDDAENRYFIFVLIVLTQYKTK